MEEKNEQKPDNEKQETQASENQEKNSDEIENQLAPELKEAREKIIEVEKQLNEYKDAYLRKAAEFDNFKRRNENEISNLLKYAAEPFIKNILSVYDDLERSLEHVKEDSSLDSLKKGIELVFDKFTKVLNAQGIKKIEAKGEPFDVDLHEALMQQPAEGVPSHTVLDVIEQGYLYKDKVIRHAKVIVSTDIMPANKDSQNNSDEDSNFSNEENQ